MLSFFSAVSFLTVIPTPRQSAWDDGRKIVYFPLVGLTIGVLLYGVDRLLSGFAYREIRSALDVLFLAVISGGLHLDGLADSADGLLSHKGRETSLEIMKDPRIGAMGALAVVFCVLLKFAGLLGIENGRCWAWFLAAPALARATQTLGLVFLNNARGKDGLGAPFFQKGQYRLLGFCIVPIAIPFLASVATGLLSLGVFAISTIVLFMYFQSRLGGMTGDTFGATTEVVETALFLAGGLACASASS
ncbi:MAG: adenosylcobinamide-GDP ribazoletransferase [Nitrospinae bacterium]|nr:adenosylcobinamide-GDP ribazoletransferase [Nitrospinota bacterium]